MHILPQSTAYVHLLVKFYVHLDTVVSAAIVGNHTRERYLAGQNRGEVMWDGGEIRVCGGGFGRIGE